MQKYYKFQSINDGIKYNYLGRWSKKHSMFLLKFGDVWQSVLEQKNRGDNNLFDAMSEKGLTFVENVWHTGYQAKGEEIVPEKTGRVYITIPSKGMIVSHICPKVKLGNKPWATMLSKDESCPVCDFKYDKDRYVRKVPL